MDRGLYVWEVTVACAENLHGNKVVGIAPNSTTAIEKALDCRRTRLWQRTEVVGVVRKDELDFD